MLMFFFQEFIKYYEDDKRILYYEKRRSFVYLSDEVVDILMRVKEFVCIEVLFQVMENVFFLVDLDVFVYLDDCKVDDFGKWIRIGFLKSYFFVDRNMNGDILDLKIIR